LSDQSLAFADLVERHRAELYAHCYRGFVLVHDADDALQDTLVRAWRGAPGLRDAGSSRSWLYTIATNVCLSELQRRQKRMLPHDFSQASAADTPPGAPQVESTWIEPYASEALAATAARMHPEATYEEREALELAFVAAVQHLGATQRAVLILREVLGFSANEVATMLHTTAASVNSALQRARAAVRERIGLQTQQSALRSLGDRGLHQLVDRYVDAWERCDVEAFTSLLVESATFAMPPLTTWYTPRDAIAQWARESSLSGAWRWKALRTEANAQPALGFYAWDEGTAAYLPFALNVLSVRGGLVADVTAFIVRSIGASEPQAFSRFPDQPMNQRQQMLAFERFGLPDRIQ
jgi:RNA polymerase sigma-70 factor, ECF subfamily